MDLRRHLTSVAALVAVATAVQVWAIRHAVVPAQDAVRYVAVAQSIERDGLVATCRAETGGPVFPLVVLATHRVVTASLGDTRDAWARAVQIAAATALVLIVVPLYFLFARLFDARSAAIGTLLFCVMAETARLGADGLADSTFLLLISLGLWGAVAFVDCMRNVGSGKSESKSQIRWSALVFLLVAGFASATAMLTKSEAIVLISVVALFVASVSLWSVPRQSPMRAAGYSACFAMSLAVVILPYLAIAGAKGPRDAVAQLRGQHDPENWTLVNAEPTPNHEAGVSERTATIEALRARRLPDGARPSFAPKERGISSRFEGFGAALRELASELGLAMHYFLLPFVIYGIWCIRSENHRAAHSLIGVFAFVYVTATLLHATKAGYLSTRHVLPLIVVGVGYAGFGVSTIGARIARRFAALSRRRADLAVEPWRASKAEPRQVVAITWALAALIATVCLSRTLDPLHASRVPHRRAAQWLALRSSNDQRVLDVRGWTSLYSGLTTYRYHAARRAFSDRRLAFVVVERGELEFESRRSRTLGRLLGESATLSAGFPHPHGRTERDVLVYTWDAGRFAQRLGNSILAN